MSGIAGILYFDQQPVAADDLHRMAAVMAHRGPDGARLWNSGPVGLAHRLLRVTPSSLNERMPLASTDGAIVLTADVRLDNRDELLAQLEIVEPELEAIPDSAIILSAYAQWGERCVERMVGDFAFVIWDGRRQMLVCARDHFGVRPFYFFRSPRAFMFASEIKALFCLPGVQRKLNELKLAAFITGDTLGQEATAYEDILRLPPAHTLVVTAGGEFRFRRYWSLDPQRDIVYKTDDEYASHFRDIFLEAVRCRLRSAFPIGAELSGGLDSSSVACVARDILAREGRGPLAVFSAIYPGVPVSDESAYIQAVVDQGGVTPHWLDMDQLSPLYQIERVLDQVDDLHSMGNLHIGWRACELAHQEGIRVMLNGIDGDSAVSHGMYYLRELAQDGQWDTFFANVQALARFYERYPDYNLRTLLNTYGIPVVAELARAGQWAKVTRAVRSIHRHSGYSRRKLVKNHVLKPLLPQRALRVWQRARGVQPAAVGAVLEPRFGKAINPVFARRVDLLRHRQPSILDRLTSIRNEREYQYTGFADGTHTHVFELTNMVGSKFGIEPRYPFMDIRVVEFALAIPASQKLHDGLTRMVLRRALAGILPEEIRYRGSKSNLGPGLTRAFKTFERDLIERVVVREPEVIGRYMNQATLQEAYQRTLIENRDEDWDVIRLWTACVVQLWLAHRGMDVATAPVGAQ